MMEFNDKFCPKCHRFRKEHAAGEDAVYIQVDKEVLVVECVDAQNYLLPTGNGKLLNPDEVTDEP